MNFDWSDLAFGSKKPVNQLTAVFIAAARELSPARFTQLVKEYLPQGNIVLGLAKEAYIDGFEGQPQFKTLQAKNVQGIIDKVQKSSSKHKIYTLRYFQRDTPYLLEKLRFSEVLFVNGSWQHSFHMRPAYYVLANTRTKYRLISPFANEAEAKGYASGYSGPPAEIPARASTFTAQEMLEIAGKVAKQSFDHTYQTGVTLGRRTGKGYKLLAATFNKVVPYQTYAMHFGSLREKNFSPANDLNFYDTIHAETALIIEVQKRQLELKDTTLFINLLPCPTCGRMLAQTDIAEFVYSLDHSDGYTLGVLERAGKKVRRVI